MKDSCPGSRGAVITPGFCNGVLIAFGLVMGTVKTGVVNTGAGRKLLPQLGRLGATGSICPSVITELGVKCDWDDPSGAVVNDVVQKEF